jgi:hypothetical protein
MASIHDSLLVGYIVDGTTRTIVLRTEPDRGMGGAFDVRFSDVVAYHFEGDCFQNIVHNIVERSPESIPDLAHAAERHRMYGWPGGGKQARETLAEFAARKGARWFELNCSFGMGGWIAAAVMTISPVTRRVSNRPLQPDGRVGRRYAPPSRARR